MLVFRKSLSVHTYYYIVMQSNLISNILQQSFSKLISHPFFVMWLTESKLVVNEGTYIAHFLLELSEVCLQSLLLAYSHYRILPLSTILLSATLILFTVVGEISCIHFSLGTYAVKLVSRCTIWLCPIFLQ